MNLTMVIVLVIAVTVLVVSATRRARQGNTQRDNVAPTAARIAKPQSKPATTRTPQAQRKPAASNRFRAVSIAAPDNACAAAKALTGKRFLVAENNVPALPLGDCDCANCACTYEHHKDRREEGVERRAPSSLRTQLHADTGNEERRERRGRRSTDWE